ncbi:type VII secretion-associated protein [Mycolicibacterium sp. 120266]|uniref:type VII secretion-associated protein n=1 Tax=Mycolicibacterium sp. 120266 TaxID=3090601 RepID=UPI00299F4A90|nr:type VII secretion-associated protein [Mycolicibacterium sp. 120266]MDX1875577.1 type VII secretion-associated protein [Mycolicibacterium sp. 120266]
MTSTPVLFGPATVRGPCPVPAELVRAGLAAVDDQHTVVDDRMVEVGTVLGEIVHTALGDACREIVLICPGWWPAIRLDRVRSAAAGHCSEVVVLQRPQVYRRAHPDVEVFVEFADEFVIAGALTDGPPAAALVVPRQADPTDAVLSGLGEPASVLIDVPAAVTGARAVATDIAARLRRGGTDVIVVGDRHLCRAAAGRPDIAAAITMATDVRRRALPWIVAAGLLAVSVTTWALHDEPDGDTTVSVVEGRVAASVPAGWTIERVTAGTGSRRVQAVEPGSDRAVLIVQSRAEANLAATAATLDTALQQQDPDVFTALRSPAERGGRTVIGYTETRAGREIDWAVFLDGAVRIAVGCQSPPGQAAQLRAACDAVIRSAHAIS